MEERLLICTHCKQELPESSFSLANGTVRGRHSYCRECDRKLARERRLKRINELSSKENTVKQENHTLHKVYKHEELAKFTNRQLLDELKERGFKGKLYFTNEIQL